mmetsp:Transcript_19929/g.22809  ORF Transcript_19929/g.22809 Transcript_19929/m.22809 type:complete len:88 (-) Transcript_19929:380-643(-)
MKNTFYSEESLESFIVETKEKKNIIQTILRRKSMKNSRNEPHIVHVSRADKIKNLKRSPSKERPRRTLNRGNSSMSTDSKTSNAFCC